MPRERLRECWPSSPSRSLLSTARWRGNLSSVPKSWTINSSTPACYRRSPARTPAPRGFPVPLTLGWPPRALAPGKKSPAETRSDPHRDDLLLQTAFGCAWFADLWRANLRTIENPAENRALLLRSSPVAAPAPPETSFETRLPPAGASGGAWTGRALAAHRKRFPEPA